MKQRRTDKEIVQKRAMETREKLLRSALELYTEKGYHSTTVDEDCEECRTINGSCIPIF